MLVVGGSGPGAFATIAEATAVAKAGDVVRVEPGTYAERIDVPDGVDLIARVPGTVTIARPRGATGDAVGVSARGDSGARIAGIRVESTPEWPLDVGVRISGQGRTVELLEMSGPMRAGIDVLPAASLTVRASHFDVAGSALALADGAHAAITSSVFLRRGAPGDPAVHIVPSAEVALRRNVFAGYGADLVKGLSAEKLRHLRATNWVIGSEPSQLQR
jgi:hypothetical protein